MSVESFDMIGGMRQSNGGFLSKMQLGLIQQPSQVRGPPEHQESAPTTAGQERITIQCSKLQKGKEFHKAVV